MAENEDPFKEKIRNSFSNVKNDIFNLEKGLKNLQNEVILEKEDISAMNSKLDHLNSEIAEIKTILAELNNSSSGNEGVINDHQRSSTIINDQQSTMHNTPDTPEIPEKTLKTLKKDFEKQFRTLTDREFSVFMAIYELEKQNGETNFSQLANHLHLTEPTVRASVNSVISKNLPLMKERVFNGKTSLFIKKDFHDLNLLNKLIRLRQNPLDQTTLFNRS